MTITDFIARHHRTELAQCAVCGEPCTARVVNVAADPRPPLLEVASDCCEADCLDETWIVLEPRHLWIEERCHHSEGD